MNWLRRRSPATLYTALIVGFVLFRVVLFAVTTAGEYRLYSKYGEAARQTSLADLYRSENIEYPHLAVAFGSLAGVVSDALPRWTVHLVRWRPNKFDEQDPYQSESLAKRDEGDRYEAALGLVLFTADAWCLWLVYAIARRVYPNEDHVARVGRLAGYVVATGAIGLILFDRQDLVVGLFALLALWALATGWPVAGYAILTLGTAYKLVPVLLLPVWVMAAAAVKTTPNATPGRFARRVVIEAYIAGLLFAVWPVLTYWLGGGDRAFKFLTFHSARGLQIEAPAAWPVLLLDPAAEVGHGYGSYNLTGQLADRVAKIAGVLMPLSALVAVALAVRGFWHLATSGRAGVGSRGSPLLGEHNRGLPLLPTPARQESNQPSQSTFPGIIPQVVAASLLIWLAFITTNKVGSPQYLLWVGPLVPLLPLRDWSERSWALLFLLAMIATTLIFPCRYSPDVIGPVIRPDGTRRGPDGLGLFLLALKSVTLILATGWLVMSVWQAPHLAAPGPTSPARPPEPTT